jgi:hypothetical protein
MTAEQLWSGPRRLQVSSIPARCALERSCARVCGPAGQLRDVDAEPTGRAGMKAPLLGIDISGRRSVHRITVARSEISRTRRTPRGRLPWLAVELRCDLARTTRTGGFRGFGPALRVRRTGAECVGGVPGVCSRQRSCHPIRPPPERAAESAAGLSASCLSAAGGVREPPGLHLPRCCTGAVWPPEVRAYPLPQRSSENQEGLEPC